ncbi:MAG TPA: flagellar motor switch phosphatase FliY [bacterium]|nr:flagellar motor switch phosphatase FliY [bacterium]
MKAVENKLLSQEEVDALLKTEVEDETHDPHLDLVEIDALGEIGNIAMGTAATSLSTLLGQEVKITTPQVKVTTEEELRQNYPYPYVLLEISYVKGLEGTNLLVVQEQDAILISELMMGGSEMPDDVEELDELRLSAVGEAMNQMIGSSATAISTVFDTKIQISPPEVHYVHLSQTGLAAVRGQLLVQISFDMTIGKLADTELMQILPLDFAKDMVATLMGPLAESAAAAPPTVSPAAGTREPKPKVAAFATEPTPVAPDPSRLTHVERQQVVVKPAAFAPLAVEETSPTGGNLELLLDIPLEVTVELGRTKRLIKDVLELGIGSVIELEKLAGEPVDVVVNRKLVARGEVVVIDENFGVRITDIISPMERVTQLQ